MRGSCTWSAVHTSTRRAVLAGSADAAHLAKCGWTMTSLRAAQTERCEDASQHQSRLEFTRRFERGENQGIMTEADSRLPKDMPGDPRQGRGSSSEGKAACSEREKLLRDGVRVAEETLHNHRNGVEVVEGKAKYLLTASLSIAGLTVLIYLRLTFLGSGMEIEKWPSWAGIASVLLGLHVVACSVYSVVLSLFVIRVREIAMTGYWPGLLLERLQKHGFTSAELHEEMLRNYSRVSLELANVLRVKEVLLRWTMAAFSLTLLVFLLMLAFNFAMFALYELNLPS